MGAITIEEALAGEAIAKANGWSEEQLLNLAGERLGRLLGRFFRHPGTVIGYLGKGHNAGDALVALRVLRDHFGWQIITRHAFPEPQWAPLMRKKWAELGDGGRIDHPPASRDMKGPILLLDGMLGSGTRGALRDPLLGFAREMEILRQTAGARVAAVDLPSGVNPDSGEICDGAVTADLTCMIGNAKAGLLRGSAAAACGALALVPLEALEFDGAADLELIAPQQCAFGKSPRPFDFHKGLAGRVTVVAGSANYSGAAVLAATGALRGGAGLVTLFVPRSVLEIVASRCAPEIIVRAFDQPQEALDIRCDALVTGCGMGDMDPFTADGLLEIIAKAGVPMVVDADALNLIANRSRLDILTENHVITPHPGEFERLVPGSKDRPREQAVRDFIAHIPATLLLKGSRTIVARHGQPLRCNSTGTPGMATGGQGDLLAGVIGARLAAGDSPQNAAAFAAWLCGRAAEVALEKPHLAEDSLAASDVAQFLGTAFLDWRAETR